MPEPRYDPLGRRTVLIAPERARRPSPPAAASAIDDPAPCDFCEGQESRTPPETFAVREPGTTADAPGWSVRVVPNRFPASPFHEVVVHTPDHEAVFESLDAVERRDVVATYAARLEAARADGRCPFAMMNRGREAGASRAHDHGQILGLDVVPPTLEREAAAFGAEPCVLCALVEPELTIAEHVDVRVIAHPVPLVAHEVLLVPAHDARMEDARPAAFADALADAIRRTSRVVGPAWNLVIHTAPPGTDRFHWHAHLMPRTGIWGALELGAELPIVAADPVASAALLRQA